MTIKNIMIGAALAVVLAGCATTEEDPQYKDTPPSMKKDESMMKTKADTEAEAEAETEEQEDDATPQLIVSESITIPPPPPPPPPEGDTPPSMSPLQVPPESE